MQGFLDPIGLDLSAIANPEARAIDVGVQHTFSERDWEHAQTLSNMQIALLSYAQLHLVLRLHGMGRSKLKQVHRQLDEAAAKMQDEWKDVGDGEER